MKVTVTVTLDDDQMIERFVEIDSAGNPLYWSRGIRVGAERALESVVRTAEAQYGAASLEGIHLVRSER